MPYTLEQLKQGIVAADAAGDTAGVQALGAEYRKMQSQQPEQPVPPNPATPTPTEPSFLERIKSGISSTPNMFTGTAAVVEPLLNQATGMVAKPIGEIAGMAAAAKDYVTGNKDGDPTGFKNYVQDKLTYDPKTKVGASEYNPLNAIPRAIGSVVDAIRPGEAKDPSSVGGMAQNAVREAIPQAIGIAGMKAGKVLADRPAPVLRPSVDTLLKEKVSLTPGQIRGGALQRIEDAATSIPLVGDLIKSSQKRGYESFNEAALNRSLAPIGQKLPKGLKGYDAVEHTQITLGNSYEKLLPNLKGSLDSSASVGSKPGTDLAKAANVKPEPTFRQELEAIREMANVGLPKEQSSQLDSIINKEIISQFNEHGLASGETLKNIESRLGSLARDYGSVRGNYHIEQLGDAVQEVQAAMRRMVDKVNPEYRGELSKINTGYANFKRIQRAASSVGSKSGQFSPSQLANASRALDRTKDKSASAKGQALMQDLASAGKEVLPSTVPDSGTPYRGALIAAVTHPLKTTLLAIPAAMVSLAYTPWGQAAAKALLTRNMKASSAIPASLAVSSSEAERQRRKKERAAN